MHATLQKRRNRITKKPPPKKFNYNLNIQRQHILPFWFYPSLIIIIFFLYKKIRSFSLLVFCLLFCSTVYNQHFPFWKTFSKTLFFSLFLKEKMEVGFIELRFNMFFPTFIEVSLADKNYILLCMELQIQINDSQPGMVLPSGVMWKYLGEFGVVTAWGLLPISQVEIKDTATHPIRPRTAPQQRITWSQMAVAQKWIDVHSRTFTNPVLQGLTFASNFSVL